ncbi:MAG TPA: hypothetical protein VJ802_16785 [Gemmatimonadaceae bacterium]|nr:hypothetical protein [Gemmatimonadaceae bacterium]
MLSAILLVVCVASIVVAQMFILRSALGTAVIARTDAHLPRPRRATEVAWAVLPAVALMFVLWMTWQEAREGTPPMPEPHEHHEHGAHAS